MFELTCSQIEGEWRTEIVREPAVIRAYLKRRQMIEEEETMADSLAPTGDAERDRRARKRYVFTPLLVLRLTIDLPSSGSKRRLQG